MEQAAQEKDTERALKNFPVVPGVFRGLSPAGKATLYPRVADLSVRSGILNPESLPEAYTPDLDPQIDALWEQLGPKDDEFTLAPGQTRFKGGKVIASLPKEVEAKSLKEARDAAFLAGDTANANALHQQIVALERDEAAAKRAPEGPKETKPPTIRDIDNVPHQLMPDNTSAALAALMGADLLRSGAGLNPMVGIEGLRPSPEVRRLADAWRGEGQRTFTCDPDQSPAYYLARAARGERHEVWSTWTLLDTLSPGFNVPLGVPSAFSPDLTMLVPLQRVLAPAEGCRDIAAVTDRLRRAAVAHVISLQPLAAPGLALEHVLLPIARLAPLSVHVYRLADPLPMREVRGDAHVVELPGVSPWCSRGD